MQGSLAMFGWGTRVKSNRNYHDPVFLNETIEYLSIYPEGIFADCTLGGGGHSNAIVERLNEKGHLHCFDRDPEAIAYASNRLSAFKNQITFHPVPFSEIENEIDADTLDGVLYDLGISSHQVDDSSRGFTFVGNQPLDLRMNQQGDESAQQWLRQISAEDLAKVFSQNADLDRSYKLAVRLIEKIQTISGDILPQDVRSVVESVFYDKRRDLNSILARVYQAIRMEINQELQQIEKSLRGAVSCLKVGGRLVVISYHSVEDRCVKNTLSPFEKDCICPEKLPVCRCGGNHRLLKKENRKPLLPTSTEIDQNPRARSAKLRVYTKV